MTLLNWFKVNHRLLLRAFVSGVLITLLLTQIDVREVIERWTDVNWLLLSLLVPLLYLNNSVLRTIRLRTILKAHSLNIPFRWLWLVQLKSGFVVSFVPGGVSGDVYRTFVIGRKAERALDSVSAVALEKLIGLLTMMSLSIVSLLVGVRLMGVTSYGNLVGPVSIIAGGLIFATIVAYLAIRLHLVSRWRLPFSFWSQLEETSERLSELFKNGRMLLTLATLSFLLQFSIVIWYFVVAQAKSLDLSLIALMMAVPVVELLLTIPISIGGVGVRDAALVILLLPFGLSVEEVVSLSLLVTFSATLMRILSGLAFLVDGEKQEVAPSGAVRQIAELP